MKIAFLGTGLMGSGFVRRLRATGHEVNVWNRSAAKAWFCVDAATCSLTASIERNVPTSASPISFG